MIKIDLDDPKFKKKESSWNPNYKNWHANVDWKAKAHQAFKRHKAGLTCTENDYFLIHMFYPFMREQIQGD